MKESIDIHVVLSTAADFDHFDDDASEACEKFNELLHYLYDQAENDIDTHRFEQLIQQIWENWSQDMQLLDIDTPDLLDWVDQLLATWEDDSL